MQIFGNDAKTPCQSLTLKIQRCQRAVTRIAESMSLRFDRNTVAIRNEYGYNIISTTLVLILIFYRITMKLVAVLFFFSFVRFPLHIYHLFNYSVIFIFFPLLHFATSSPTALSILYITKLKYILPPHFVYGNVAIV